MGTRNGYLKLHIVKIYNQLGFTVSTSDLVSATEDCVAEGANVILLDVSGGIYSQTTDDAMTRIALNNNVILIAPSGDTALKSYPASYSAVMSVTAVDETLIRPSWSFAFNDQIELSAPGSDIYSTSSGGGYAYLSDSHPPAAYVAGVAALVWSHYPWKSASEVKAVLRVSAKDLGIPGKDFTYGYGLVQADAALRLLSLSPAPTPAPTSAPTDESAAWTYRMSTGAKIISLVAIVALSSICP